MVARQVVGYGGPFRVIGTDPVKQENGPSRAEPVNRNHASRHRDPCRLTGRGSLLCGGQAHCLFDPRVGTGWLAGRTKTVIPPSFLDRMKFGRVCSPGLVNNFTNYS